MYFFNIFLPSFLCYLWHNSSLGAVWHGFSHIWYFWGIWTLLLHTSTPEYVCCMVTMKTLSDDQIPIKLKLLIFCHIKWGTLVNGSLRLYNCISDIWNDVPNFHRNSAAWNVNINKFDMKCIHYLEQDSGQNSFNVGNGISCS